MTNTQVIEYILFIYLVSMYKYSINLLGIVDIFRGLGSSGPLRHPVSCLVVDCRGTTGSAKIDSELFHIAPKYVHN